MKSLKRVLKKSVPAARRNLIPNASNCDMPEISGFRIHLWVHFPFVVLWVHLWGPLFFTALLGGSYTDSGWPSKSAQNFPGVKNGSRRCKSRTEAAPTYHSVGHLQANTPHFKKPPLVSLKTSTQHCRPLVAPPWAVHLEVLSFFLHPQLNA